MNSTEQSYLNPLERFQQATHLSLHSTRAHQTKLEPWLASRLIWSRTKTFCEPTCVPTLGELVSSQRSAAMPKPSDVKLSSVLSCKFCLASFTSGAESSNKRRKCVICSLVVVSCLGCWAVLHARLHLFVDRKCVSYNSHLFRFLFHQLRAALSC